MKRKNILFYVLVALLVLILIFIFRGCGKKNAEYKPEGSIEKGYEFLEKEDYEKACEEFEEYLYNNEIDPENPYQVRDRVSALLGLAKAADALDVESIVAADVYELLKYLDYGEMDVSYAMDDIKELAKWYLLDFRKDDDISHTFHIASEFADNSLLEEYIYKEEHYDKEEPHKIFTELYIGGEPTGVKYYTGREAKVSWVVEGYEDKEPYREFERKYIEGEPSEEIRYTGKTKPKENPVKQNTTTKKYPYANCPICKYSAAKSPSEHPGHGWEGATRFERGQNSDGSWGFLMD